VPPVISFTVIGLDAPVPVLPEEDVTVYPVIAEPPVELVVKDTETTPPVPPDAVPIVGDCGTVLGVNDELAELELELPLSLVATAVKV
jgi:hypothetical protein